MSAGACHISPAVYALAVVYPSISLNQLRSFAEHRSHADPRLRTNVVETGWAFSLLFLNNNLHVAHHAKPSMPWYRLPRAWREMTLEATGTRTTVSPGYRHLFRSYWFLADYRGRISVMIAALPMYDFPELHADNDARPRWRKAWPRRALLVSPAA